MSSSGSSITIDSPIIGMIDNNVFGILFARLVWSNYLAESSTLTVPLAAAEKSATAQSTFFIRNNYKQANQTFCIPSNSTQSDTNTQFMLTPQTDIPVSNLTFLIT